jgi:hypothetical protein
MSPDISFPSKRDSTLPHYSTKIGVTIVGHTFVRFILARNDGHFWTGTDWSPNRHKALLYFHLDLIQKDRRRLLAQDRRRRK